MWYFMEGVQKAYSLSERLMNAISVETPCATSNGEERENIEELLRQGADVNHACGFFLPIHYACMMAEVDVVSILLRWGADVNQLDGFHRAPLHHAAEKSSQCVKLLLNAGAETEVLDLNGNTPLHWAAFRNQAESCRLLLQSRANVNARDHNDDTPLNWAATKGNFESVRVLLEYNALPDIVSHAKMLPITRLAVLLTAGLYTPDDESCFEYIMKAMGNIEVRNTRRDTPGVLQLPSLLATDVKVSTTLNEVCSNARSLRNLSRFVIRKSLGSTHLPSAVASLPLPRSLKDFLLLKY